MVHRRSRKKNRKLSRKKKNNLSSLRIVTKGIGVKNPYTGKELKLRYRPGTSDEKAYSEILQVGKTGTVHYAVLSKLYVRHILPTVS